MIGPMHNLEDGHEERSTAVVASVLDSLDTEALDWLTKTYLWEEVAEYGRSSLRV